MRSSQGRARSVRQSCRFRKSGCPRECLSRCSALPSDVRLAVSMVDRVMRTIHSDVAVIGGGLVGMWTAYFLRKRGHSVAVIEKGAVGSQASGVNFGNVRLQGRHPTEFPHALRAHELWEQIERLIGERCEFSACGHAYIALDPNELPRLERYQAEGTAAGLDIELWDAHELRRRYPWLGSDVCGATWSKRDGTANPRLATPAVARAARALGVDIFPNTRVVPALASAQVIRVWSGIEGYLPDMLPVMGWSHTTRNLLHAFGFCGHGFQLSPGVGYTLAEMIDEGRSRIPVDAFKIDRFIGKLQPDQERLIGEFDAALASAAMGSSATQVAEP